MKYIVLKWPSALEMYEVLKIADHIGFKPGVGYIYRLNLLKCASLDSDELERILRDFGVFLEERELRAIESLRGYDALISLEGTDLVLEFKDSSVVKDLIGRLIVREPRHGTLRAAPGDFWRLFRELRRRGLRVKVDFETNFELSLNLRPSFKLRDYQLRAYLRWKRAGGRGVIVLPVATGKTLVGIKAIEDLRLKTLVLVPTIDLLHQWASSLSRWLGISRSLVGIFGGGVKEIKEITVMTYDSARLNLELIADKFGLIIADECHHAVSPSYRVVFKASLAPYRMGLTATPFRSDALHKLYPEVIGNIVYEEEASRLQAEGYLASHEERRIYVRLSPEEYEEYLRLMRKYMDYCRRVIPEIQDPKERFKRVLKLALKDPEAREALRARHRARQIALSAERKIKIVEKLLREYSDEKVLIFSRYTDIIRELARRYFIPRILHDTPKDERRAILEMFKRGEITKLATAMALDEGVDVPDASVAIVISGTGSNREYLQRLGRILRPKRKKAIFIELITKGTVDYHLFRRRRRREIFEERA